MFTLVPYRRQWADYFDSQGIQYAFFSAANATALQEARREAMTAADEAVGDNSDPAREDSPPESGEVLAETAAALTNAVLDATSHEATPPPESETSGDDDDEEEEDDEESDLDSLYASSLVHEEEGEDAQDPRARVLSVLELEDLFTRAAPDLTSKSSFAIPVSCRC